MRPQIKIDKEKIVAFCKKHHITKFGIFGSILGEFDPNHIPGFAFFGMEDALSELLGRKVDLNTPKFLSRYFRDQVMKESETLYEAA